MTRPHRAVIRVQLSTSHYRCGCRHVGWQEPGVVPDERLVPTPEDLAANRDPVLSRAAAGVKLDPAKTGAMFPVQWRK